MTLISAKSTGNALLQEMDDCLQDTRSFYLWWLGQSGYLLQWNGKRVLIDPYLSDSLTYKYAKTDKPHVRMSELVIDPGLFRNISIVSSSHNHTDHLDAETLIPILKNNPGIRFIIPEANRDFVCERVKCEKDFPIGMNDGQTMEIDGFTFTGLPAKHNEVERDDAGNCRYMGFIVSFGPYSVYHSGDTLWIDELPDLLRPYQVDVALLPINGNDPSRRVAGNLNSQEAVDLAQQIGAKCVIPCHYDMFTFNTADVSEFQGIAETAGQNHCVLIGGEYYKGMS